MPTGIYVRKPKPIGTLKPWSSGYIGIKVSMTGNAHVDWIHEHRHVMETHLDRKLSRHEVIHHKDGNPKNNSLENLDLITQAQHRQKHRNPEKSYCHVSDCKNKVRARGLCSTHWKNWKGVHRPRPCKAKLVDSFLMFWEG